MYGVYDCGVVTHRRARTRTHTRTTCNNLPRKICDNLLKRHFYFLITYGVCEKRKYCNRMSEKKKILSFW